MQNPRAPISDPDLLHKLTRVASRTGSAVVIGDAGGCVEWVNEAFSRLTGFAAGEVVGKRLQLLAGGPDEDADALEYVLARFSRGEASQLEIPVRTKSGSELWLALEVQPVGDDGDPGGGFLVVARDVTERKRAERALAESEERYRQLVELSPEPIGVHCEGRWVFLNAVAARLLGAERPDSLLGRPVMDFVHADSRRLVEDRIRRILETGEPAGFQEVRVVCADGRVVEAEIAGARVRHGGRPAVQLVARDLTDRRRAELERQAKSSRVRETRHAERLATLAGGMAHDLNNLLGAILGEVDLALGELSDEEAVRESLTAIRRESLRAAGLTNRLLSYAGKGGIARQRVDVSTLVMQTSELLEGTLADGVILNLDLAGNLPPVLGDAARLRDVLVELVQNAVEAMAGEAGSVSIRTRPGEDETGQPCVRVEVSDTGCGMSREVCGRAFEPFFTTKFAGRGLGLSAAQGVVHAHRGTLRISSRVGRGTEVLVRLPCAERETGRRASRRRRASLARTARTVLVVDDEDSMRSVARRLLEREGFRVRTARGGREAVRIFRERAGEIGVVLLDLTMPGMDGAETLRELRLVRPDARVVLMTGYGDLAGRIALEDLAGFLPKPYEPSDLVETLRRALAS